MPHRSQVDQHIITSNPTPTAELILPTSLQQLLPEDYCHGGDENGKMGKWESVPRAVSEHIFLPFQG